MNKKFPETKIKKIIEEAMTYKCACPAQVAELLLELRRVEAYERSCLEKTNDHLAETHSTILEAVDVVHERLETCLDRVLDIEGWDRSSLKMPEDLRRRS